MEKLLSSGEDYLKAVYSLCKQGGRVRSVDLASYMNVSKPSVFKALKNLKAFGFIKKESYGSIKITNLGQERAEFILKKHAALKQFLVDILGIAEDKANSEACKIEHCISDSTAQKLFDFINKL